GIGGGWIGKQLRRIARRYQRQVLVCPAKEEILSRQSSFGHRLFWREGGDDFFKPRITAQRIPIRIEAEVAVRRAGRNFGERLQLLDCKVAFASPGTDYREKVKSTWVIESIHPRTFESAPALAQRLFF